MKKILVPIDFTEASRNASEYAASLAKEFKVPLQLLHVYLAPIPATEPPLLWTGNEVELQEENNKLVKEEIHFLKDKYGVAVSGSARTGIKGDVIKMGVQEGKADLVVMGIKKEKEKHFVRSTVFTAIRKEEIPVLVVPQGFSYQPIKNIVLAVDFDGVRDASCFASLFEILDKYNATLQVLHVAGKAAEIKAKELPGKLQLERILASKTYWYHPLDEDNVEQGILKFTQSHPADLLVMVAHRHSFFERVFGTVHTRAISYQTGVPLLVLEDKAG